MPNLSASPDSTPEIELHRISVVFGSVLALDAVDLRLRPGERHAVVGENGAGKSTLMRVLFGLQTPLSGDIRINGQPVSFPSPAIAMAHGVGMVQQHFELIDAFSVAENILLGAESAACRGPRFDYRTANAIVRELAASSGLPIDANARVSQISVAGRQRVEILKALYRKARVLILDEPTAILSPSEAADLWRAVRRLSQAGTTVVFVSHKLEEVLANADTVTVLRQGRHILTTSARTTTAEVLANAMVGTETLQTSDNAPYLSPPTSQNAQTVLRIEKVTVPHPDGRPYITDASLDIRAGEIVGIAGVDGSGQIELIESLIGLRSISSGRIFLEDRQISGLSVRKRKRQGIAYIPADRHAQAVVLPMNCEENVVLGQQHSSEFSYAGLFLNTGRIRDYLMEKSAAFDVRGSAVGLPIRSLSGGNQQKLVLARELSQSPRLLIAAQPSRGLDFAATAFVHTALRQERNRGCAVLLQSLDLSEILALSDRVAVVREGRIVAVLNRSEATLETLGAAMTGARQEPGS